MENKQIIARELRIGNWVIINDKTDCYGKVFQIDCSEVYGHNGYISAKYIDPDDSKYTNEITTKEFQPIPLTEKILLKCGFKKRLSSVCDFFYIGVNPYTRDWMFDITWLKNHIDYTYEDYPFYKNGYHKIKYLHQLQNLYFALTGEELEINL